MHPDPDRRYTSLDQPEILLREITGRPARTFVGRTVRNVALQVDTVLSRWRLDVLAGRSSWGLVFGMLALAAVGQLAGDRAHEYVAALHWPREAGDAAWGLAVALLAGLGAAGEPAWRLDWRRAIETTLKVGLLSAVGGGLGMGLASMLYAALVDGQVPSITVAANTMPIVLVAVWLLYGVLSGVAFGTGLWWAHWRGIGRAAVMGGLVGGLAGGAAFAVFAEGLIDALLGIHGLTAARFYGATALFGVLGIATAFTYHLVADVRLLVWTKLVNHSSSIAVSDGTRLMIGRNGGAIALWHERPLDVQGEFLTIQRTGQRLLLTVLPPAPTDAGRGRVTRNGAPLGQGEHDLYPGNWLLVGRGTLIRVDVAR